MRIWLPLFLLLICTMQAAAEDSPVFRRKVSFEWESVENAKSYDLEIRLTDKEHKNFRKTFTFHTKDSAWSGRLIPGYYLMKLRSHDERGVPGAWSPDSDLVVGLDKVEPLSPPADAKIKSIDAKETSQEFHWKEVAGAQKYHVEITSEDGTVKIAEDSKDPSYKTKLPVAHSYTWKVSAINDQDIKSESTQDAHFLVQGPNVEKPQLKNPESDFVRDLSWTKPPYVTKFDVYVIRLNPQNKKWEIYKTFENQEQNSLVFDPAWPGGQYELIVKAKGDNRGDSALSRMKFLVREGDRTTESESSALVRQSIERSHGWYKSVGLLVGSKSFSSQDADFNSDVSFSSSGIGGRFGLGWMTPKAVWGFDSHLDIDTYQLNGKMELTEELQLNAVHQQQLGAQGEFKYYLGLTYQDVAAPNADLFTGTVQEASVKSLGPDAGISYAYAINNKWGLEAKLIFSMGIMKMGTPNSQALQPEISTELSVLADYCFHPGFTGLFGIIHKDDEAAFKSSASGFSTGGETNKASVTGNYLSLSAEWSY